MKSKVLLLMVLLIGITCLVVYGRRRAPTYEEQRRMQKQLYGQQQAELNRMQSRKQSRSIERKQRQGVSSNRLTQLEVRVANLEHALITQLTHRATVSSSLKSVLDNETILRSRTSKAEVERVVHTRIAKTIESRAARELK